MKTKLHCYFCVLLVALAFSTLNSRLSIVHAQGTTAFTYQGQLHDTGTNANGTYTMIFKLYDASSGGNSFGTNTSSPTLANGLFSVNLDFGNVFNGGARWLDITVSNNFVVQTLSPRVQVLPAPYAQFAAVAATVTNGAIMNAQLAGNAVNTTNIQNGAITTTQIAANAVTNANLAANAVNATNIASGQVVKTLNGLTDFVTLTNGANTALFTNGNALTISATVPNISAFRSSGTFVVPTNVTRIEVEIWGGGGGGGSSSTGYSGGGGGGGGYNLGVFAVTPDSSYTVTVGSGGNAGQTGGATSFGALMTASGGGAGGNGGSFSSGAGGAGGGNSGGAVSGLVGGAGDAGDYPASSMGGVGGSTWRGGVGGSNSGPALGGNGGNSGGGSGIPGQAGNNGLVIVYY